MDAASGIALNVIALSATLSMLGEFESSSNGDWTAPLRRVLLTEGGILCLASLARALPLLYREACSLQVVSCHSTLLVAIQMLFAQLTEHLGALAVTAVYATAVLNCALCVHFVVLCVRQRALPEPFWFPATVSPVVVAVIGQSIQAPHSLMLASLLAGCFATAALWPLCVWRVLRNADRVAPDPTCFVLMAPIPIVTMAMFSCRPEQHTPLLGTSGMDAFFVLNCINVLVCFVCAFQRRQALARLLRPLQPTWASLTFPLVSNCYVALYYAHEYRLVVGETWAVWASSVWSTMLVPVAIILVPSLDLLWMFNLPTWCCMQPAAEIEMAEMADDPELCAAERSRDPCCEPRASSASPKHPRTAPISASTSSDSVTQISASTSCDSITQGLPPESAV